VTWRATTFQNRAIRKRRRPGPTRRAAAGRGSLRREHAEDAPDHDDGKATGNPNTDD
jgi:hypothetical protein